ncbi:MAG TPA: K(+)-transporting ATPase subunit C [Chlamydiales bacterium]|nr:K(+)-transporting ATPase subunit C [Chlamydiales bacterium]
MKLFIHSLKPAFLSLLLLSLILGLIYPLFMTAIGELFFHKETNGSLLSRDGKIIGSQWIAQNFTRAEYFHPRPSSAGDKGYDAANSSASNLGPTSQKLIDTLRERAAAYRVENNLAPDAPIPAEAVTASGSGLDPHISPANALLQANRIATARGFPIEKLKEMIEEYTEKPMLGFLGEKKINVLRLNLALDHLSALPKENQTPS